MTRVLLVDDDPNLRGALEAVMRGAGHDVTVADDGLKAVAAAVVRPPEIIVSDVHMPVLEGPDMIRMLHAIPHLSSVPIILMSGVETEASVPVARMLKKPFEPAVLLDCVARASAASAASARIDHSQEANGHAAERANPAAEHAVDDPALLSWAQRCALHMSRGLALAAEQAERVNQLNQQQRDAALAKAIYETLLSSVATLAGLQQIVLSATVPADEHRCAPR